MTIALRLAVSLLCVVYIAAATILVPQEYRAAVMGGADPDSWHARATLGELPHPASLEGQYAVIESCQSIVVSEAASVSPEPRRQAVKAQCLDAAERVLRQAPSFSHAHLLRGQILLQSGANDAGFAAILASEQSAPNLSALSLARLQATLLISDLPRPAKDQAQRDIARLTQSPGSVEDLAHVYAQSQSHRDVFQQAITTVPPDAQLRFVVALRARGAQDGS